VETNNYRYPRWQKVIHHLDRDGRSSSFRLETKDNALYYYYHPVSALRPHRVILSARLEGYDQERFFSHGFQSWSPSALLEAKDRQEYTGSLFKPLARYVSGQHIFDNTLYPGYQMSWNFTYWYASEEEIFFMGSLDERNAYTVFYFRPDTGHLIINRDWEGMQWQKEEEICLAAFDIGSGEKDFTTKSFFIRIKERRWDWSFKPLPKKYKGWTSWYQYYDKIDEKICCENLDALASYSSVSGIFQIDDGYETKTGDWLCTSEKFSSGMQYMAEEITRKGMKPGLWLAPFTAVSHSELAKNNPAFLFNIRVENRWLWPIMRCGKAIIMGSIF